MKNELLIELMKMALAPDAKQEQSSNAHPYEVGKNYHVRTVTMAIAGRLKAVYDKELVFENASWVADSGRFHEYLKDTSKLAENETFVNDVIVGRGAIVDATEIAEVYSKVK